MKTAALTGYLDELDTDEVAEIYEETPAKILRSFNATPGALRSLIEDRFPEAVEDAEDDEDADEEEDEDDEDDQD